jgi:hypothetical protein
MNALSDLDARQQRLLSEELSRAAKKVEELEDEINFEAVEKRYHADKKVRRKLCYSLCMSKAVHYYSMQ